MDSISRIQNNSIYKRKKKKKKTKKTAWHHKMQKWAGELNDRLPKSEQWFQEKFKKETFGQFDIQYNVPFKSFIYDVYIKKIGLVIEVDGSIHNNPDQIVRDQKKDARTAMYGLKMVRVKAYDEDSYNACISMIKEHIVRWETRRGAKSIRRGSPKVILRKCLT